MTPQTIAFIGGGNMASSLIAGLIADGYDPQTLHVSEPDEAKRDALAERFGVRTFADNLDALRGRRDRRALRQAADGPRVCRDIAPASAPMGRSSSPSWPGSRRPASRPGSAHPAAVVRTMPNTPAMVQTGAIGMHAIPEVDAEQRNRAETILRACGLTRWVADEALIDAVTAVSGSGPAYFFRLMEAMEQAGIELGLDPEDARLLTIQTALGAARMAMESDDPPQALREQVTSPGGTTERALAVFDEGGFAPWWSAPWAPPATAPPRSRPILAEEP